MSEPVIRRHPRRGMRPLRQSKWMAAMRWTGQEGYLAAPTEDWMVDGKVAGICKEYENLTVRLVLHRLGGGS